MNRIRNVLFVAAITFILLAWAKYALAQQECYPLAAIADNLKRDWNEDLYSTRRAPMGARLRLFRNEMTDTWSAVLESSGGCSGLVAAGTAFDIVFPGVEG